MFNAEQSRKIALCYVRTRGQQNGVNVSRESQRMNILAACGKMGLTPEFYEDNDPTLSGNNLDRSGWQALKARLGDPCVAALVVDEQTRITRNIGHWLELFSELKRLGLKLHYAALNRTVNFDKRQ